MLGNSIPSKLEGGKAWVTLRNKSGHSFPSGFPGRSVILSMVGLDSEGLEVWRNFSKNAMEESPGSVFNKVYLDSEGQPTLPPMSKSLGRDSRLKPDEVRTLSYDVPETVLGVTAKLSYHLLPAKAAQTIGVHDPGPVTVAEQRAAR